MNSPKMIPKKIHETSVFDKDGLSKPLYSTVTISDLLMDKK